MTLVAEYGGFQRLEGVYPEELCLVTKNAGRSLVPKRLKSKHRYSVMLLIFRTLAKLHQHSSANKNLTSQNTCVQFIKAEPKVTLTDFAHTTGSGSRSMIQSKRNLKSLFTPETCGTGIRGVAGWNLMPSVSGNLCNRCTRSTIYQKCSRVGTR